MNIIATDAGVKLSSPSKMKGTCKTWSTLAVTHCPGARGPDGGLVEACGDCYADKGFYLMGSTKAPRVHNAQDWKRDEWVADMVRAISGGRGRFGKASHFRFFDSGDCYHIGLARKILEVVKACPDTLFWIPTRMHKFKKFMPVFKAMNALPNCVVRFSSDSTNGGRLRYKNTSTIVRKASQIGDAHLCPATVEGNKANCKAHGCTACWSSDVKVVAYNFH